VRLQRLRLVNFRQHRETEIEFGPGLMAVIGPNGSGKSTLLEAMAWALYGMEAARGTRDSIRWRLAKPRTEVRVELEFGLGPHEYRVVRTLYGADLYLDSSARPIATSLGEVTARLTRILGMSREEFFNTYFTGQKELAVMAAMKPTERGQFLSRLLGYDKLRLAQEKARERRSRLRAELAGLQQGWPDPSRLAAERERLAAARDEAARALEAKQESLEAARSASDSHLPVFREMTELRDRHAALVGERRLAEERLRQAVDAIGRLEGEHAAAARAESELGSLRPAVTDLARVKRELAEQDALARDAAEKSRLEAQLAEIQRQLDELARQLGEAREAAGAAREAALRLEADRSLLEAVEREWEERRAGWLRDRQDAQSKRQSLLDQYRDLEAQRERIVAAGESGACPTCGRPLGAEYASVLELLSQQLEEVKVNGLYFRGRLEQLEREPDELRALEERRQRLAHSVERGAQELAVATRSAEEAQELGKRSRADEARAAGLRREIRRLRTGYDAERHEALRRRAAELEPVAQRAERLAALAERTAALGAELRTAERKRAELVEEVARLERELAATPFTESAYQAAEREMERLEREWRQAELDVAVARAELGAATDRLRAAERAEREAAGRAARAAEVETTLRLHNELDRALGDLRTELNLEMRPELADLAADFLSALTDGRYDEILLDEEYNLTVLQEGQPQPVISGGEQDLANLVLRLAVSQMIADRSGQPLSLLVLDEIFGSLDEVRRGSVLRLLRALEARFPQVVLISHIEDVRESADRVLRVRFDEASGCAVVNEERVPPPESGDANVAA
jgi:exonuclease SbcC